MNPRRDQQPWHGSAKRVSTMRIKQEEEDAPQMPPCEDEQRLPDQPAQLAQLTSNGFSFLVPIPQLGDDLETTFTKIHGLADAVANGGVLTSPNPSAAASHPQPEPEAVTLAKRGMMTPTECKMFEDWNAGRVTLPQFNWDTNQDPVPPQGLKTFTQRAAAMDVVWQREGTTPAHAVWLSTRMAKWVPLVKAVEKVLKAQVQLEQQEGWNRGLTAGEMAELQTLQQIDQIVEANIALEKQRVAQQADSINESMAALRWRLKALGRSLPLDTRP